MYHWDFAIKNGCAMTKISSLFVHKVISHANPDLDRADLFQIVGLDPNEPAQAEQMVSEDSYYDLFETLAAAEEGKIDFHIRTGASMRCEDLGALGLAWKSSPTLRDGFERASRYVRLLVRPQRFEVVERKDNIGIVHRRTNNVERFGAHLTHEVAFVTTVSICRDAGAFQFTPVEVRYEHDAVGDRGALEAFFGCPVRYNAERDEMLVSRDQIDRPTKVGDTSIFRFFDSHLDAELSRIEDDAPLEKQVRDQVSTALSGGVPTVAEIATSLEMSRRTLQRRLSNEGFAFHDLLDDSRRELAERLLRTTGFPLTEVAFLTGFSEQSAFTRAFKRWSGQTPRAFRLESQ